MAAPEQYLPFPPETNLLPVYLLGLAIVYNGLHNLFRIVRGEDEKTAERKGGER